MGELLRPAPLHGARQEAAPFLTAEAAAHDPNCAGVLVDHFVGCDLAHVLVFASPSSDFPRLMAELSDALPCTVIGCTTAGEIGGGGYTEDTVLAIGLPRDAFTARTVLLQDLSQGDLGRHVDRLIQERIAVTTSHPSMTSGFSVLMVDGLSCTEDELVSAIGPSMANFPLFGGSAGDGLQFQATYVAVDGALYQDAAAVTFIATSHETRVFSINHMKPTETRMVVTEADPRRRVVKGINAEPAAAEYARLIGKDPGQLDELIFAANPVTVCVGGQHHARAIKRVDEDGHLVFFSAIDEGMVLTVAAAQDMANHLDAELSAIRNGHAQPSILGFDCVHRRLEAQRSQAQRRVNDAFQKHGVVGFSTYGEQIGTMHVNHTMTGVAIFPAAPQQPAKPFGER